MTSTLRKTPFPNAPGTRGKNEQGEDVYLAACPKCHDTGLVGTAFGRDRKMYSGIAPCGYPTCRRGKWYMDNWEDQLAHFKDLVKRKVIENKLPVEVLDDKTPEEKETLQRRGVFLMTGWEPPKDMPLKKALATGRKLYLEGKRGVPGLFPEKGDSKP